MNRRDLLQWLYSGCIAAVGARCAVLESAARPPSVTAVIYDRRYPESMRQASALAALGAQPFDIGSDVLRLWRGPLRRIASAEGTRIVGLVSYPDFLISRGSATEMRLRLISTGVMRDPRGGRATLYSWIVDGRNAASSARVNIDSPTDTCA